MKKNILLFCFAVVFSSSSLAEKWYIDGGLGFVTYDESGFEEASPTNIYFRGGYKLNKNFDIGLEVNVTADSDSVNLGPVTADVDVDIVTFYARGGTFVSDNVWLYGQVGSSNTEVTVETLGFSFSEDDTDLMFGFGADIGIGSGSTYVALNYSIYNGNNGIDVTGFNLGIGTRF